MGGSHFTEQMYVSSSKNNRPSSSGSHLSPRTYFSSSNQPVEFQKVEKMVLDSGLAEKESHLQADYASWEDLKRNPLKLSDFEIGQLLGEGKFGSVHLARHISSGHLLAIKKMSKMSIRMHRCEIRIVNELRIHTALSHPNVIDFYGNFHDEEDIYFALELASEGNLYDLIKEEYPSGIVPEEEVKQILQQLVQGIKYLHDNDFAHRDLKPENILISLVRKTNFISKIVNFYLGSRKDQ